MNMATKIARVPDDIAADAGSERSADKRAADPRWQRTRERLLKAGFEVIGEAGADNVGMDAITARAGISKPPFGVPTPVSPIR